MLHDYEARLLFILIVGGCRKAFDIRTMFTAPSPPARQTASLELVLTGYFPHCLLVTSVPHIVRDGSCMCSQPQPSGGVLHGSTFLSRPCARAAVRAKPIPTE